MHLDVDSSCDDGNRPGLLSFRHWELNCEQASVAKRGAHGLWVVRQTCVSRTVNRIVKDRHFSILSRLQLLNLNCPLELHCLL